MVFVDFEHWYIALDNLYHRKPDIKAFRDELSDRYDIIDIAFFGDFSNPSLRSEITNIRQISNNIIETQNASVNIEKDFTDFIMLDHIYQSTIMSGGRNIEAYVLLTGDGHFSSVVSFLVTKCRKEVGVYAVKDSASAQLLGSATYSRLLPDNTKVEQTYAEMILLNLKNLFDKNPRKKVRPTFWATVEAVSKYFNADKEEVASALRALIQQGYIYQVKEQVKDDTVKVMKINWSAVYRDKLIKS